jgi:hypothetical protein
VTAKFILKQSAKQQAGIKRNEEVAAEVVDALEKLAIRCGGKLVPDDVVAEARNPRSPLHQHFEWDDSEAAEKWRKEQARSLIASVRVVFIENDKPVEPLRYFINVPVPQQEYYMNAQAAFSDIGTRSIILVRAIADLHALQRRYGELEELASVWGELNKLSK